MQSLMECVPEGWWSLADADTFYPDDLPEDWRLTYFANAFPAVLVPAALWQERSVHELSDWRADVHAGFRFFLDCPATSDQHARMRAAAALGPALAAFVMDQPKHVPRDCRNLRWLLAPQATEPEGIALLAPRPLNTDLRSARGWLDALPHRHCLVILDTPTASELDAWQQLIALMGRSLIVLSRHHHSNKAVNLLLHSDSSILRRLLAWAQF